MSDTVRGTGWITELALLETREVLAERDANMRALAERFDEASNLYVVALRHIALMRDECMSERSEKDLLAGLLTWLSARSEMVANEVLLLLRGGFPSAGWARARTLHEIAVTAVVLATYSDEFPALPERYSASRVLGDQKGLSRWDESLKRSGGSAMVPHHIRQHMAEVAEEVRAEWAKTGFDLTERDYSWARPLTRSRSVNNGLEGLRELAGLDEQADMYSEASIHLHSTPRALGFRLSHTTTFYAAAAQFSLLSLQHVSEALLINAPAGLSDPFHARRAEIGHLASVCPAAFEAAAEGL